MQARPEKMTAAATAKKLRKQLSLFALKQETHREIKDYEAVINDITNLLHMFRFIADAQKNMALPHAFDFNNVADTLDKLNAFDVSLQQIVGPHISEVRIRAAKEKSDAKNAKRTLKIKANAGTVLIHPAPPSSAPARQTTPATPLTPTPAPVVAAAAAVPAPVIEEEKSTIDEVEELAHFVTEFRLEFRNNFMKNQFDANILDNLRTNFSPLLLDACKAACKNNALLLTQLHIYLSLIDLQKDFDKFSTMRNGKLDKQIVSHFAKTFPILTRVSSIDFKKNAAQNREAAQNIRNNYFENLLQEDVPEECRLEFQFGPLNTCLNDLHKIYLDMISAARLSRRGLLAQANQPSSAKTPQPAPATAPPSGRRLDQKR